MVTRLYYRFDRFYFPYHSTNWDVQTDMSGVAGLTPTYFNGLDSSKAPVSRTFSLRTPQAIANPTDIFWQGFVSLPIGSALTLGGTVKGQARVQQGSTAHNQSSQMKIYVIDGTTGAIKSTLYAGYTGALASEWSTTTTNRRLPLGGAVSLTPQSLAIGDRLLIMVGSRAYVTAGTNVNNALYLGSVDQGDLPEDETTTTGDAWVEFSTTLTFGTDFNIITFQEQDSLYDDAWTNRIGDPRDWLHELTGGGGGPVVPTEGQIWPRAYPTS